MTAAGPEAESLPLRLLFVGDLAFGDHPKTIGFGVHSKYPAGLPRERGAGLFPQAAAADIVFGNLEYSLNDERLDGEPLSRLACRGMAGSIPFLAASGFSLVNVANNHIFQYGPEAFRGTLARLERSGIRVCGTPADFEGGGELELRGQRVRFLGWSDRPRQYSDGKPPYNEFSEPECYRQVERARQDAEIVCASIHWGEEFIRVPSERERSIARKLIEHGATVVIGHHPHVLREIEQQGGGLVAYSLGNFIGDMIWDERTRQTGCLWVEVRAGRVSSWRFHPAVIGSDYFPRYLGPEEAGRFQRDLAQAERQLDRQVIVDGYAAVASREHRWHVRRLAAFFLRNLFRYRASHILAILRGGAWSRLRPGTSRRPVT